MTDYITHEDGDTTAWVCRCSNTPSDSGFAPCDSRGNLVEPTVESGWSHLYRCLQCCILIDQRDLSIVDEEVDVLEFVWRGITIQLRHRAGAHVFAKHLEVYSIAPDRAPLPITSTGYLSHFYFGKPKADLIVNVTAWLDEEAAKPEWKNVEISTRQLTLF